MSKRAIILAGGKGTRLRPYTVTMPKPLVPIGDKPILEIIIKQLIDSGFDHITMTVNHMADLIIDFFGNGSKWGVKIDYSLEKKPLSTMGPLSLIKDLPDNFLVMNGDVLSDIDYASFYEKHIDSNSLFTISSFKRIQKIDYGVLIADDNDQLIDFKEKPENSYNVSMGIYMANKAILKYIPQDQAYGFDHLMLDMIADSNPAKILPHDGYWMDIGRPEDYIKACETFDQVFKKT